MTAAGAQTVLGLGHRVARRREDFVVSRCNEAAAAWIDRWPDWPAAARGLWLHGPAGSGKSHLGAAWAGRAGAARIDAPLAEGTDPRARLGGRRHALLDGFDARWPGGPVLALYEAVAERGGSVLVASREAPARLALRPPDLASRLAALPVAALGQPDEALLAGAMAKMLRDRQIHAGRDALEYLANRMERSFAAAARTVALLDEASLAERRPVTLPLARAVLQRAGGATRE